MIQKTEIYSYQDNRYKYYICILSAFLYFINAVRIQHKSVRKKIRKLSGFIFDKQFFSFWQCYKTISGTHW